MGQWGGDLWAGLMYSFIMQYNKDYWVYEDLGWRFTAFPWKGSWILDGECMVSHPKSSWMDADFDGLYENGEEEVKEEEKQDAYTPNAGHAGNGR